MRRSDTCTQGMRFTCPEVRRLRQAKDRLSRIALAITLHRHSAIDEQDAYNKICEIMDGGDDER